MLRVSDVDAGYGKLEVLWNVSLEVNTGELVALVGPNGAGKTTVLRTISGIITPTKGKIFFKNQQISGLPVQQITRKGISYVTDDGCLFAGMTVMENLMMGAYTINDKRKVRSNLGKVFELFPRLAERRKQYAGSMSGGERKMLAIARGLMADPMLMLVDEPSYGLAPKLVMGVFYTLKELSARGVTVLLVEQNVNTTLKIVDRGYVLEQGSIVQEGGSKELRENDHIKKAYLGIA